MKNNETIKLGLCGCALLIVNLVVLPLVGFSQETNVVNDVKSIGDEVSVTNIIHSIGENACENNLSSIDTGIFYDYWGAIISCLVAIGFFIYKHKEVMEVGMWFLSLIKSIFGCQEKGNQQSTVLKNCADNGNATMIAPTINGTGNTIITNINCDKSQTKKSIKEKKPIENCQCQDDLGTVLTIDKLDSWLNRWLISLGFKRLQSVDGVKVRCPKDRTIIFVVDDKQGKDYEKGLKSMGYESVRFFARYPTDNDLKECAIIIFDVRGVGNSAGSDGFALAKHYKATNPLKKVMVRSGYLTKEQIDSKGELDNILDKDRDMCEQVDPLLRKYVEEMGDPIQMWKRARLALISKYELKQVAFLEHKYVQLINSLADTSGNLPGNWMTTVNNVFGICVF